MPNSSNSHHPNEQPTDRRSFLQGAAAAAALSAMPRWARAHPDDFSAIRAEIEKRHDEAVKRLQTWIRQPSIAAENRGMNEGCELMIEMLREAGFSSVKKMPTDGQPGVFATLDAGAPKTLGLYFMYDVKQADPAEWSSPPFEAALLDKPGLGKIIMGRGAVNQKGPEATLLAAFHAIRGAGKKMPINLVFVAEGEEEIGSPHGAAARARTCTPATKRDSTVPPGISLKRWPRSSLPTATIPPSKVTPQRLAHSPMPKRKWSPMPPAA